MIRCAAMRGSEICCSVLDWASRRGRNGSFLWKKRFPLANRTVGWVLLSSIFLPNPTRQKGWLGGFCFLRTRCIAQSRTM